MKKTKTIILQDVVFSLLPALCAWLSQSNLLDRLQAKQYIGSNVNIVAIKDIIACVGVILTFLLLSVNLIVSQINEKKYHEQRDRLIENSKNIFLRVLAKSFGKEKCDIEIRIFVPEKHMGSKFLNLFKKRKTRYFTIKNINGLADPGITDNLHFEVYPGCEGLVGKCYRERTILYDDDLEHSNESKYNLKPYQISKTNDLRFILVCPIFDIENNVIAISAFDSKSRLKVTDNNKDSLTTLVLNYTQELYRLVPELFK